ncbi:MAG: PilT/PilU family type 4a pilus ATPase [Acidimicrobiia bacterium]|nr:PilT/PilU family type 4a pilus ATPase [Acidimicrobiia bacterium]
MEAYETQAAVTLLEWLLDQLVAIGGSDLLLSVGTPPRGRVDGALRTMRAEPLTDVEVDACVEALVGEEHRAQLAEHNTADFAFDWTGRARFRGNVFRQKGHWAVALRHLPAVIPAPEQLGVPPAVVALTEKSTGLVIVTGPTGSGKSTTIASLIERINQTRACHVITLEDPIEYVFTHKHAVVDQREVGTDTPDFHMALRSVLREDPDVVLVGEMRDLESISSALTIAETGHLVFATLHTNDTAQAVDRIIDAFGGDHQNQVRAQLSAALLAVVHQRLHPSPTGGRVAAFEVLIATDPVRNLIREAKTNQIHNVIRSSRAEGMVTLEESERQVLGLP